MSVVKIIRWRWHTDTAWYNHYLAPPTGKTVIVIPTYNEADNLPALVAELLTLACPGSMC